MYPCVKKSTRNEHEYGERYLRNCAQKEAHKNALEGGAISNFWGTKPRRKNGMKKNEGKS
jgi:hypothetical protein